MTKKVLGLVMAALAFSTIGAFAQTENQNAAAATKTEKVCAKEGKECKKEGKECKKEGKECKKDKKGPRKGMDRKRGDNVSPFAGIELTAEQKQQLEALKAERKTREEARKQEEKQAKEQDRKAFDEQVAQILTPEQFVQYQSNCDSIKAKKGLKMKGKVDKVRKEGKGRKLEVQQNKGTRKVETTTLKKSDK